MGILIGFYIAALAAVSSFRNDTLDRELSGRPVKLVNARQGKKKEEILTRRRFLAVLFGYCAVLSICLYIAGSVETHFAIGEKAEPWLRQALTAGREVFLILYTWRCQVYWWQLYSVCITWWIACIEHKDWKSCGMRSTGSRRWSRGLTSGYRRRGCWTERRLLARDSGRSWETTRWRSRRSETRSGFDILRPARRSLARRSRSIISSAAFLRSSAWS